VDDDDVGGPSKEEMIEDLKTKTKQLDHAQKVITEQQRIIAENKTALETKGTYSHTYCTCRIAQNRNGIFTRYGNIDNSDNSSAAIFLFLLLFF